MGQPTLNQTHYGHSDDANADPDANSYTVDTARTVTALSSLFIVRFQVSETNGYDESNTYARVYRSLDGSTDFSGPTAQVTQNTSCIAISSGVITEGLNNSTSLLGANAETWSSGYSIDVSDEGPKFTHVANTYREHSFCLSFEPDATAGDYFLRFYYAAAPMDNYAAPGAAKVTLSITESTMHICDAINPIIL